MRRVVVLRPAPGNAATVARLAAAGLDALALPLFRVVALGWQPPDPRDFDAVLLTSANAVRHARDGLAALRALPVVAVGEATARAARDAGCSVAIVGTTDAAGVVDQARRSGFARLLHLAGRDRAGDWPHVTPVTVYANEAAVPDPAACAALAGTVVLLHSVRAATLLGAQRDVARGAIRLAAISPHVAAAAGSGWEEVAVVAAPSDDALVALAARLARRSPAGAD